MLDGKSLFATINQAATLELRTYGMTVGGILKIRAAIFPEETHAWRKSDQGWLFASSLKIRKSYA